MDEYDQGMDPEVKRYFRKIINSFSFGLLWMITVATVGFFLEFAIPFHGWHIENFIFYALALLTFLLLIRYYVRVWR
jgi:hypothetical protein